MKRFFIIHVIFSFLTTGILFSFIENDAVISFLIGSTLSILNSLALGITWRFILTKKRIALAISVIVFKYAILMGLIYSFVSFKLINLTWLVLGVGSIAGVGLVWGLLTAKK